MSRLQRYILLLTLSLIALPGLGQRRYSASDRVEHKLSKVRGFSTRDVDNKTDAFLGLHASLYDGAHHLVGFSVDGGWSTYIHRIPGVGLTPGGGAASAKFLYEYQFGHIFLQTGLGFGFQQVSSSLTDSLISPGERIFYNGISSDDPTGMGYLLIDPLVNADGTHSRFMMKHVFGDRTDMARQYYAQLPLNVGYYIVGPAGIGFIMLGAQLNYIVMGSTTVKAKGTSTGLFEDYIGVVTDVDGHGFRTDVPMEHTNNKYMPLGIGGGRLDVLGHIEGGYEFNTFQTIREYRISRSDNTDCRIRFSAYLDISLPGLSTKGAESMYEVLSPEEEYAVKNGNLPPSRLADFHSFGMNHVLMTPVASNYKVRNLTVGVRFSVLFSMQAKEHCILCDPWRH